MPYILSDEQLIILYGKNIRSRIIRENLKRNGFENILVVNADIKEVTGLSKTAICVVSFQNAMRHDNAAYELQQLGYDRIIFLPMESYVDVVQADILRAAYNVLLYGDIDTDISLPLYSELNSNVPLFEGGIISRKAGMVTFWARVENLFINNVCQKKNNDIGIQYYGENIVLANHYKGMFRWLEGDENSERDFWEYCATQGYIDENGIIKSEKIEDRFQLLQIYNRELERGKDFFVSSASLVEINDHGGLNIKEGLHRAVYLLLHDFSYIPVQMPEKSFNFYFKKNEIENIWTFIKENRIGKTITPIAHPAFYNFPAEKENMRPTVLSAIVSFLGVKAFNNKSILDISDYNSYFAQYVGRCVPKEAVEAIVSQETDLLWYQFAKHLNSIYGLEHLKLQYSPQVVVEGKFDIVFMLGKYKGTLKNREVFAQLAHVVKEVLIYEADIVNMPQYREFILSEGSFEYYKKIHQYYDGKETREVGVFFKGK